MNATVHHDAPVGQGCDFYKLVYLSYGHEFRWAGTAATVQQADELARQALADEYCTFSADTARMVQMHAEVQS